MSNEGGTTGLFIVCGLQGTGKTTVASALAKTLRAVHLRNDVIRKELFPAPLYNEVETDKTYEETLRRAEALLHEGKSVVIDATFTKAIHRAVVKELAQKTGSIFLIIRTHADEGVVEQRMRTRTNDASDAVFADHLKAKSKFDTITEPHVVVDTNTLL